MSEEKEIKASALRGMQQKLHRLLQQRLGFEIALVLYGLYALQ